MHQKLNQQLESGQINPDRVNNAANITQSPLLLTVKN